MVVTNQSATSRLSPMTRPAGFWLSWRGRDKTNASRSGVTASRSSRVQLDTHGQQAHFGNALLAANGKALWASFQQAKGTNAMSYGLMEIPFSEAPPRELMLIKEAPVQDETARLLFPGRHFARWQDRGRLLAYLALHGEADQTGRLRPVPRGLERPELEGDQSADSHARQALHCLK